MAFSRPRSYRRTGGRIMRRGGQFTKKFRSKVIRTVQRMSPRQYKTLPEPPCINNDMTVRRWVRMTVAPNGTNITIAAIAQKDREDYLGNTTTNARFQTMKVLKVRAWGPIQGPALTLTFPQPASGQDTSSYTDYGDGMRRACVAVELPASTSAIATNAGTSVFTFVAGTVEIADVYCEMA